MSAAIRLCPGLKTGSGKRPDGDIKSRCGNAYCSVIAQNAAYHAVFCDRFTDHAESLVYKNSLSCCRCLDGSHKTGAKLWFSDSAVTVQMSSVAIYAAFGSYFGLSAETFITGFCSSCR